MAEKNYSAQARYDAANVRRYGLKLNKKTDADIIEFLDSSPNVQAVIKAALREEIKRTPR